MSDSLEAHLLDLKHKSNTSSEEEGSSTGDDERTSDELDLHSEVIKLTDELSAARKKISKLELDINTSNSKLMYSTEKTATIDLLLDEKKELEDRLHGMQQNIHNGNDIQYNVNRYNRELENLRVLMDQSERNLSLVKNENERLVKENQVLLHQAEKHGQSKDIKQSEEGPRDLNDVMRMEKEISRLSDSLRAAKANAASKDKMAADFSSQLREAKYTQKNMEKDLGTAKKSNHMLSKEIKRMKDEQSRQDMLRTTDQEIEKTRKRQISALQEDLQKTRLELIEVKHNQTCATLEKSQIQSQLKTARIRLREAAETATHKENRLIECTQKIDNDTEIIANQRLELEKFHTTIDAYRNFPDHPNLDEGVKNLLAAREESLFLLSNECLESRTALQIECGRTKLLEDEMAILNQELRASREENSLLFKEMDVTKDDLRRCELQRLILENKLNESETSSRILQCEIHELKLAMAASKDQYMGHMLANEEMQSNLLSRQQEFNDIIMKQENKLISSQLNYEQLKDNLHQIETSKTRMEESLVACHLRMGDLMRGEGKSDGVIATNTCSQTESILTSSQIEMLRNSNRVLTQKLDESNLSLSQTRHTLAEEKRQHLGASAKIELLQKEIQNLNENCNIAKSISQTYIKALEDKENIIIELRNNLFRTRKELEAEVTNKGKLTASLKEEENKVMYSEYENSTLKSENDGLRSSKIEIINAYKSRVNELEVIAHQTSEDISIEKVAKRKLGQERLSLLRLIRDLKANLEAEMCKIQECESLVVRADEAMNGEENGDISRIEELQIKLNEVSNEKSNLRVNYMKETSYLKQANEKLQNSVDEKNDSLLSAHSVIESLNEELTTLHQSFNSLTSNKDQIEILSVAFKKTNDELWDEQQMLLHDALSSHAAERAANELRQEQYDRWLVARREVECAYDSNSSSNMNAGYVSELETELSYLKRKLAEEKGSREATESLLASFSENTTPQVEKKIRDLRKDLSRCKEDNAKISEELTSSRKMLESAKAENIVSRNIITQLKDKIAQAEQFLGASFSVGSPVQTEVALKLELEGARIEKDKHRKEVEQLKSSFSSSNNSVSRELESQLRLSQANEQKLQVKLDEVNKSLARQKDSNRKSEEEIIKYLNQLKEFEHENNRLTRSLESLNVEFSAALDKMDNLETEKELETKMAQQTLLSIDELTIKLQQEKDEKDILLDKIKSVSSTLQQNNVQIKELKEAREEHLKRNGIISKLLQDSQNKEKKLEERIKRLQTMC